MLRVWRIGVWRFPVRKKRGGGSGRSGSSVCEFGKEWPVFSVGWVPPCLLYLCRQACVSLERASVAKALLLSESGEILWGFVRAGLWLSRDLERGRGHKVKGRGAGDRWGLDIWQQTQRWRKWDCGENKGTMSSLSRELVFLILQFLDEEKFKETVHK